jgi:hypothetical protein
MDYEQQKSKNGSLATYGWLATGAYLFWTDASGPGILSWQAAIFLIAGMFAASVVLGMAFYAWERLLGKLLSKAISGESISEGFAAFVSFIGVVNLVAMLVVTFFAAKFTHAVLFG